LGKSSKVGAAYKKYPSLCADTTLFIQLCLLHTYATSMQGVNETNNLYVNLYLEKSSKTVLSFEWTWQKRLAEK
jgi:hypothetical protein